MQDIFVTLRMGELVGVIGPNGAGKTTLLRCLAGVIAPDQGKIQRAASVYLPQVTPAPFAFTPRELVGLSGASHVACEAALAELGLLALAGQSLLVLSGGERQRAALARVLAQESDFLLLDEPFAHLDLPYQLDLIQALKKRVAQGKGVVLVLHELGLAQELCDRLLLLHQGRLVADATPDRVLTNENLKVVYGVQVGERGRYLRFRDDL